MVVQTCTYLQAEVELIKQPIKYLEMRYFLFLCKTKDGGHQDPMYLLQTVQFKYVVQNKCQQSDDISYENSNNYGKRHRHLYWCLDAYICQLSLTLTCIYMLRIASIYGRIFLVFYTYKKTTQPLPFCNTSNTDNETVISIQPDYIRIRLKIRE